MLRVTIAAAALVAAEAQGSICAGNVNVMLDGFLQQMAVAVTGGDGQDLVTTAANSVTLKYGPRAYVIPTCTASGFTPAMFTPGMSLLGKQLSVTVDLSTVGCGCNAAFYFTLMPAYDQNNQPVITRSNDYYCDANSVSGYYCPEMDVMEANNAALQVTPHRCDAPQGHYYPMCDRGGCGVNSYKTSASGYGPGSSFTIDTTAPFNLTTTFATDATGSNLVNVTSVMTQGSASFTLLHTDAQCGSGYLQALSTALSAGMTLTLSLWGDAGSTMSWLDVPPCNVNTACDTSSASVTFSDIAIVSL